MSKIKQIGSLEELNSLVKSEGVVVADFYADWCGPCKVIAPVVEQMSNSLTEPGTIAFAKIDVDRQQEIAQYYHITAMPTFMIFKNGEEAKRITGADPKKLQHYVKKLLAQKDKSKGGGSEEAAGSNGISTAPWKTGAPPKGFSTVTDEIDIKGLEVLNASTAHGAIRSVFDNIQPTSGGAFVESDTDEQLLIYIPFQSTLKIHTLQLNSSTSTTGEDGPGRPKTIKLFTNRPHNLSFDEAESLTATQEIILDEDKYDEHGTINIPLYYVRYQNVTSLVLFIVDTHGDRDTVRVDRLRIIGQAGGKRDPGKLEKIEDD